MKDLGYLEELEFDLRDIFDDEKEVLKDFMSDYGDKEEFDNRTNNLENLKRKLSDKDIEVLNYLITTHYLNLI